MLTNVVTVCHRLAPKVTPGTIPLGNRNKTNQDPGQLLEGQNINEGWTDRRPATRRDHAWGRRSLVGCPDGRYTATVESRLTVLRAGLGRRHLDLVRDARTSLVPHAREAQVHGLSVGRDRGADLWDLDLKHGEIISRAAISAKVMGLS